ncbi:uncharacterized protein [Anabrus simplex]|uniref:uncharacterized protein n=1 Tax=Anabrus simplex TaxID=316456 RepID=UPI0035A3108F
MISSIVSRLVILVFGTLYPAYASYKAVRTKNVKEYVKWMMYWIVFALFTCAETFTDVFLSFWFPFYYEIKIILVLWLLSPATKGSSILYRKFVHPMLSRREQDIDEYIAKAKEQGYHTVLHLGTKGVNYATTVIMQTAIKGGGGLVQQLRRSYSLSDLSTDKDMADVNRNSKALSNIPDDDTDEADEGSIDPRLLRSRGYSPRRSASGSGRVEMYFPEVDVDVRQHASRQREPSIPLSHIRSSEDVSSGYSSAEPLYAGHHPSKGEGLVPSREPLMRTASVGSTRSVRPKSSRGGVVSKRTPTTEDSERWTNEEADFPNQEEYTYYVSSSLPSQLASIPLAEQSLSQAELLLLLQEIRTLKAQNVAGNEAHPVNLVVSETIENEFQLTETKSENIPEVCGSEPSAEMVDNCACSLSMKSPVSESVINEYEVAKSKPETLVGNDESEFTVPSIEPTVNLPIEVVDESEMFVDAAANISSNLNEDKPDSKLEQTVESPHSEDTFVDADASLSNILPDVYEPQIKPGETVESSCTEDTFVDADTNISNSLLEVKPEPELQHPMESLGTNAGVELNVQQGMNVSSESENITCANANLASISDITVDLNSVKVEDKPAGPPDAVQFTNTEDSRESSVEISGDKIVEECPKERESEKESQHIPQEVLIVTDKALIYPIDQEADVSVLSETSIALNSSAESSQVDGLGVDESAISDTFADSSVSSDQINESKLLDMSDDLNASSETLKLADEASLTEQLEDYASTATAQIPEQTSAGISDEKKDIRSGRYHKRLAPAPPEKFIESAGKEMTVLNSSSVSTSGKENSSLERVTEEGGQVNAETAVKARLVLQPGIVKSVGPETSAGTSKFISSSPKAKRKAALRSKSKQKGSAISRLLVMPKNPLEHFASYLPFWGNRDSKTTESVSSAHSNTVEQVSSTSQHQKEKESISEPHVPPPTYLPPPKRTIPMSSCSLEYLPYVGDDNEFESSNIDKAKSSSIGDFKIREMSHSPPSSRRTEQPSK